MQIAKELAGFDPAEAETLRRAIGKKIHELMASLKGKFLDGCAANGVTPAVADQLWKDMESSQDYSFNKAHSACYALIAYRTAWLKANHPCEYMAALISSVMNTKDRVPLYVNACDEMGIEVLPPDVNASAVDFAVVEGKIRFGLNAVKNVGESAAQRDRRRPRRGRAVRVDLGLHRARRPAGREQALARVARQVRRARLDRRVADGDARGARAGARARAEARGRPARWARRRSSTSARREAAPTPHAPSARLDRRVREGRAPAAREGDARALRLRAPALAPCATSCGARPTPALGELERRRDGEVVTVGGIVSEVKHLTTKRGEPMVFLAARRPDRLGRGRRLQLDLPGGARALRRRPDPRRQGPRRPQAAGRDEAHRPRADGVRGGRRAA